MILFVSVFTIQGQNRRSYSPMFINFIFFLLFFRTSTITYLNYLDSKYNLGLENLKTHIVVLPGGTKFMKILLEIIRLVMREEIKKYTKIIPPDNK